jgi:hypothetical protein
MACLDAAATAFQFLAFCYATADHPPLGASATLRPKSLPPSHHHHYSSTTFLLALLSGPAPISLAAMLQRGPSRERPPQEWPDRNLLTFLATGRKMVRKHHLVLFQVVREGGERHYPCGAGRVDSAGSGHRARRAVAAQCMCSSWLFPARLQKGDGTYAVYLRFSFLNILCNIHE